MCPKSKTRQSGGNHVLKTRHPVLNDDDNLFEVVAIFREPYQRLASSFASTLKEPICCGADWGWNEDTHQKALTLLQSGVDVATNNFLQGFRGCQTDMIKGRGCNAGNENSDHDVHTALGRIDLFLFVGLQEQWALSMRLFSRLVTGQRFVTEHQLTNNRPTNVSSRKASVYETNGYPEDEADNAVYRHATARFERDLAKYNINRMACSFDVAGGPFEIPLDL